MEVLKNIPLVLVNDYDLHYSVISTGYGIQKDRPFHDTKNITHEPQQ